MLDRCCIRMGRMRPANAWGRGLERGAAHRFLCAKRSASDLTYIILSWWPRFWCPLAGRTERAMGFGGRGWRAALEVEGGAPVDNGGLRGGSVSVTTMGRIWLTRDAGRLSCGPPAAPD
jgi:hypothetical protein